MNNTIETYMGNAIKDKNINTFLGFLEGIAIDGKINGTNGAIQHFHNHHAAVFNFQHPVFKIFQYRSY